MRYIWFDCETSGLADSDVILEWAALTCDDGPGGSFEVVDAFTSVVRHPTRDFRDCDPYVVDMHGESGLWAAMRGPDTCTLEEADSFLCDTFQGTKLQIAGQSVHFDYRMIRHNLPNFFRKLSHRLFDVSVLREAFEHYCPGAVDLPTDPYPHRAEADIRRTIRLAKAYSEALSSLRRGR